MNGNESNQSLVFAQGLPDQLQGEAAAAIPIAGWIYPDASRRTGFSVEQLNQEVQSIKLNPPLPPRMAKAELPTGRRQSFSGVLTR